MPRAQRFEQRRLVNQFTPRRVDQPRSALHLRERLLVHQSIGSGRKGRVQRDVVGLRQHLRQGQQLHSPLRSTLRSQIRVVCQHTHFECLGTPRDFPSNAPQPH